MEDDVSGGCHSQLQSVPSAWLPGEADNQFKELEDDVSGGCCEDITNPLSWITQKSDNHSDLHFLHELKVISDRCVQLPVSGCECGGGIASSHSSSFQAPKASRVCVVGIAAAGPDVHQLKKRHRSFFDDLPVKKSQDTHQGL